MLKTKNIYKWLGYEFEPVGNKTGKDYLSFVRNLKAEMKAQLASGGCEIIGLNKGYFYVSGFVYSRTADRYVYFSTGDVRDKHWCERILYRSATGPRDFKGGTNRFTGIEDFGADVLTLLAADAHKYSA